MHNTFVQVVYRNSFYFLYSYTTQTKLLFRFSRKKADDNSPALLFVFYIFTIANIFAITGNFCFNFRTANYKGYNRIRVLKEVRHGYPFR